jgi:hypothetical protein
MNLKNILFLFFLIILLISHVKSLKISTDVINQLDDSEIYEK